MKRFLMLGLVGFVFLSGCGPKAQTNVLRYNNGTEPQTIDPAIMTGHPEFTIAVQIFEGLTAYDPKTLNPVPAMAESWTVSADGLVWTFTLRSNVVWSDGTPITAKTFKDSWLRALAPETAAEYAYQLYVIKNGEAYNAGKAKATDVGIKVIDDRTLQVTLENPTPYFLQLTAFPTYMPVPLHVIQKAGDKWILPENLVVNGPFKIKEWIPNQKIVFVKNETYWDKEKVKLDQIEFYAIEDNNTALEKYLNNELDWLPTVPTDRVGEMLKHPDTKVAPQLAVYFYRFNTTDPTLKDPRVRRALYLSIDRKYIIDNILKAGQQPAYNFVPSLAGYTPYVGEKENVEKAKKLLAEAGYPDGKGFPKLTILYNTSEGHKKIAEAIQQMWKKNLGIDVALENQEWKVYLDRVGKLQYQIARAGWIGDYPDPNTFLDMFVTGGGNNQTGYSNPQYDELIKQAAREKDPKKRMAIFRQVEEILMRDLPVMPIYFYVNILMWKPYVKGIYMNALDLHPLKEAYLEK
ncbi:MAG: peptide ABC transporter substrate-binding protein [Brevinematales bacterium]|nr:peptide ABC transporter substrate-binding protein [Brevinematales bacterium]